MNFYQPEASKAQNTHVFYILSAHINTSLLKIALKIKPVHFLHNINVNDVPIMNYNHEWHFR